MSGHHDKQKQVDQGDNVLHLLFVITSRVKALVQNHIELGEKAVPMNKSEHFQVVKTEVFQSY